MAEAPYTTVARSLVAVAASLGKSFSSRPVGAGRRLLQIKEPLGPSSAGGKLSRQVVTLSNAASSIGIGWLDVVNGQCGLKEYPMLKLANELRGAGPLDFTADDYAAFTALLTAELSGLGVTLTVDVVDTSELRTEKTSVPGGAKRRVDPVLLVLGGVVLLLVMVAVLLLRA
ncbi:MAG: hypothetical protein GQE15_10775 [Archangiaceae bacterium]|nr:hypothetical protein [Archangiaceae bacterium]